KTLYAPDTKFALVTGTSGEGGGSSSQVVTQTVSPNNSNADPSYGSNAPLGVIGSRPSGMPGPSQPSSIISGPPIPISGSSGLVNKQPGMQGSPQMPIGGYRP